MRYFPCCLAEDHCSLTLAHATAALIHGINQDLAPAVSVYAATQSLCSQLPIAQSQTVGGSDLPQMPFCDLVQHLQPLPLFRAQLDPLLFHRAPRPLEKRTFLLCTIRTFSFCGDNSLCVRVNAK